jgi:hypothetical protein
MKNIWILLAIAIMQVSASTAQMVERTKEDVGYMGLSDFNLAIGRHNYLSIQDPTYIQPFASEITTHASYFLFHLQDGLLSNYFWSMQDDKRIKFGITETLDIGYIWGATREVYTRPGSETQTLDIPVKKFIGGYEAGLGIIFRLGVRMDVGFTFYPFITSSFSEYERYAKFRFRYNHFLGELSAFGKNAFDFRYLKRIQESESTMNYFFGISIMKKAPYEGVVLTGDHHNRYVHVNFGLML